MARREKSCGLRIMDERHAGSEASLTFEENEEMASRWGYSFEVVR